MYFELVCGFWISDYKSFVKVFQYQPDIIINLSGKKIEQSINISNYSHESIADLINDNLTSLKNVALVISSIEDIEYVKIYLVKYAKITYKNAELCIQSKITL